MSQVTILLIVLALSLVFPVFTIWSLNTLFGLSIALSFETWFAAFWLTFLFSTPKVTNSKEKSE